MPTAVREVRRRNHTVNRSYLRRFADESGLLTGVELPGDARFPVSVGDATVRKNFYVVRRPDGSESDQAEEDFGRVESNAAIAVSSLIDDRAWPISSDVRTHIAEWTALQYLRVCWVRQLAREIAGALSEVGLPVTADTGERITPFMPADQVDRHGAALSYISGWSRPPAAPACGASRHRSAEPGIWDAMGVRRRPCGSSCDGKGRKAPPGVTR